MRKGRKIVFVLGLVGRVFVSIIVAKYNIFPRADNGRSREKKFWQSDLLTPSVSIEIWSTLTYPAISSAAFGFEVLRVYNILTKYSCSDSRLNIHRLKSLFSCVKRESRSWKALTTSVNQSRGRLQHTLRSSRRV